MADTKRYGGDDNHDRNCFDFYIGSLHIHGRASPEALSALSDFDIPAGVSEADIAAEAAKLKQSTDSLQGAVDANQPK